MQAADTTNPIDWFNQFSYQCNLANNGFLENEISSTTYSNNQQYPTVPVMKAAGWLISWVLTLYSHLSRKSNISRPL